MDAVNLLLQRNSSPKLKAPAPNGADLETIFQAALRAPDHARLRPWRFLTVTGEGREELGNVFAEALALRKPGCSESELLKAQSQPLRAPLLVVVIVQYSEHPKVPHSEQLLSAGCAAHGMLLAAQALGYAGIWRTGENAFDSHVMQGLGLAGNEAIAGYLYLGVMDGAPKSIPELSSSTFVRSWPESRG